MNYRTTKVFLLLGSLGAFLAVALGAFGAHALRSRISIEMLEVYKTGVQYHMVHALGLILIGQLCERMPNSALLRWSGWLLAGGIVLFSGSLYALALTGARLFGAITPLGGLCFLAGWALLIGAVLKDAP